MWRVTAFDHTGREIASLEATAGEITIGRESDRQLVLSSPSVSRRHARLVLDGPQPFVVDEGSANGVVVDGVKIAQPTPVGAGARIDIAEFHLKLEVPPPTETVRPIEDRPAPTPGAPLEPLRLVAEGGPLDGKVFDLPAGTVSVGRAVENQLAFDDPSLSRKHCRLTQVGADRIELEDLGSSNGTYVNGRKVDRGTAVVGDALRFGELQFRIEGETAIQRAATPVGRRPLVIYALIAAAAIVVVVGVVALIVRSRARGGGGESIEQIAAQAAAHLAAGREKMAGRQFDAAAAEFQLALKLDPANVEARRLKTLATSEPLNERMAQQLKAKTRAAFDRPQLAQVVPLLAQLPSESMFHDPAAKELASKLVVFGQGQCRGKKWSDCAWALCKAREVAPATARGVAFSAAADNSLREAERKLAKDRSYTPCKLR